MKIVKTSPALRRKDVAFRSQSNTQPFFRLNRDTNSYEFVIEFYDDATGSKYSVVGSQLEWETEIKMLETAMQNAPA